MMPYGQKSYYFAEDKNFYYICQRLARKKTNGKKTEKKKFSIDIINYNMKQKYMQIIIAILLISLIGGWQIYNYKKNTRQETVEKSSFIPVKTTINAVFPSGTGFRRSTIITVNYTYQDSNYVKTIRKDGYVEGRFKEGDSLMLYLNPANPEEIVTKTSSNK